MQIRSNTHPVKLHIYVEILNMFFACTQKIVAKTKEHKIANGNNPQNGFFIKKHQVHDLKND